MQTKNNLHPVNRFTRLTSTEKLLQTIQSALTQIQLQHPDDWQLLTEAGLVASDAGTLEDVREVIRCSVEDWDALLQMKNRES
ncbi:hypothetical protein [Brunnivagina elsteri]|uniref:Uncharacterized protein n=1 Tax=Brunnivagina elsteri CCALA 953 TaxID=987040 RepID=A0A2A2TN28_9CYAN|nr:hypothetical protein [Calothrix elsteri]PAX59863.1 hypothetical protein CK510_04755 [Calothrix elsteri CCALA 953]